MAVVLNEAGYRTNNKYSKKPDAKRKGGPRPFTKDTVRDLLRNKTYLGLVKYKDELFPGKHPALVTQELFDSCQATRKAKSKAPQTAKGGGPARVYLLAGLLRCGECGGKLHSARANTNIQTHRYYRCYRAFQQPGACSQKRSVRAEELEAKIEQMVRSVAILPDWRRHINGLLNGGSKMDEMERQRQILEAKFDRLRKLYIDGDISSTDYERQRDKIQRELNRLQTPESISIEEAAALLEDFAEIWRHASLIERKKLLQEIFDKIAVKDRQIVEILPNPSFAPFFPNLF